MGERIRAAGMPEYARLNDAETAAATPTAVSSGSVAEERRSSAAHGKAVAAPGCSRQFDRPPGLPRGQGQHQASASRIGTQGNDGVAAGKLQAEKTTVLNPPGRIFQQGLRGMQIVAGRDDREQQQQRASQRQQRPAIRLLVRAGSAAGGAGRSECAHAQREPDQIKQQLHKDAAVV